MGFLDAIGSVLGGWSDVKQIDKEGFDFREKRAQDEFLRQRQREAARQADEERNLRMAEDVLAGAGEGETPDIAPFLQATSPEQRNLMTLLTKGRAKERKSALAREKAASDAYLRQMTGGQRLEEIEARGGQQQALARVKADLEAGRQPSPRDLALIEKRGEIQTDLFNRAEAGRDRRFERGFGGRPQLRLVSDGKGGTEYRWIQPGEALPGAPTATQRETAGMAGNLQNVLGRMEVLAPEVTSGPLAGRASKLWQSAYPSGEEGEFDAKVKQLIDLAYIQSGKQINRQELELKINSLVNRSRGNVPFQVEQAKEYINAALEPYMKSGAVERNPPLPVRSREEATRLPVGAVFTFNGKKLRKVGPGQYEAVP